MRKITVEITLNDAAWEVIETRAKRTVKEVRKELGEAGEEFTLEDAVNNELQYILDKDIETYDIYDKVRHSDDVQCAIKNEIRRAVAQDLKSLVSKEKKTSKKRGR